MNQHPLIKLLCIVTLFVFEISTVNGDFETYFATQSDGKSTSKQIIETRAGDKPSRKNGRMKSSASSPNANSQKDFYQIIVSNNLFRPLGYRKPKRSSSFELIATLIDRDTGKNKALIQNTQNGEIHYVELGEAFAGAKVKKIEPLKVTLFHDGKSQEFRISKNGFLSGEGGRGRRGRNTSASSTNGNAASKSSQANSKGDVKRARNKGKGKSAIDGKVLSKSGKASSKADTKKAKNKGKDKSTIDGKVTSKSSQASSKGDVKKVKK